MKYLAATLFLLSQLYSQLAFSEGLVKQDVATFEEKIGMRFLYMIGQDEDSYATLDCQSFIHELKFIQAGEELYNYLLPEYECQELYEDLSYRAEAGKKTCIMIDPATEIVYVRIECRYDPRETLD